jgi:hypothetical protein
LPDNIGISPIFNVANLYPYKESNNEVTDGPTSDEIQILEWEGNLPKKTQKEVEAILDKRMTKETRGKSYYQYLIKWKGQLVEYST